MRTVPERRIRALCLAIAVSATVPHSLHAGVITVDSTADHNIPTDPTLTLREALLMARGDRAPLDLVGDDDEASRVAGSVGAGIPDLIEVTIGAQTIMLSTELPSLNDPMDSIDASSLAVVDGSGIAGTSSAGIVLASNGHTVVGLTLRGFATGLSILSADNGVDAMIVEDCTSGVVILQDADGNDLSNFVVRNCDQNGVLVLSSGNDLSHFFVYGNGGDGGDGVRFQGPACEGNVFRSSAVGIDEFGVANGNEDWGIAVVEGASLNTFGDPDVDSAFSDIANNGLGGILVSGATTELNLFHSMRIGYSSTNPGWNGNGEGPGILVTGGATDTLIGKQGANTLIAIGGHATAGIVVEGPDTDGTWIERVDIGGFEPLISMGNALVNAGHGIEVRDGADETTIAGPMELRQVDVNHTGGHGIFINGDNAADPIEDTVLGYYHIGDLGSGSNFVIGGDAIRIAGNVDGVVVGGAGHRNTTNSATEWGLHLDGPNVKNIELVRVVTGEGQHGFGTPNQLGGILIENGVDGVTFREGAPGTKSIIHSNHGPGLMIDMRGTPPKNIAVRNAIFGISEFGESPVPNIGGGIVVSAEDPVAPKQGGPQPVVADNVSIGDPASSIPTVISGNTGPGLLLQKVEGVRIANCYIGLNAAGDTARPNSEDGIRLDNAPANEIGAPTPANARNVISGNMRAGIYLGNTSYDVGIVANRIGTNPAGTAAFGNGVAGVLVTNVVPPLEDEGGLILGTVEIGGPSNILSGGSGLGSGNLISGNPVGILVDTRDGPVSNVTILGNLIGTNLAGTGAVPNTEAGIRIVGAEITNTTIGMASGPIFGNLISGNALYGIDIDGASDVRISQCQIGTNAAGSAAIAGQAVGVNLNNASGIDVGGTAQNTAINIVSGNEQDGILVNGSASNIRISANRIGTNKAGTAAIANGIGVHIGRSSGDSISGVVVGGDNPAMTQGVGSSTGRGNLISGNTEAGIRIDGSGLPMPAAPGALRIEGNFVGTALDGSAAIANGTGMIVEGYQGEGATIGHEDDATRGNLVSGNTMEGVRVSTSSKIVAARNLVGCRVGPDSKRANGKDGIALNSSTECVVRRNTIRFNTEFGVRVSSPFSEKVRIENNSIHRNVKGGIELEEGANAAIAAPKLDRSRVDSFLLSGTTIPGGFVEVFADPTFPEEGRWGQGRDRVAELTADGDGKFSVDTRSIDKKGIVTATVRDATDNTSTFAAPFDVVVVQTTAQEPAWLLAGKPTAIRVLGDSGKAGDTHTLVGEATLGGNAVATEDTFVLRRAEYYAGHSDEVRRGLASLDMIVPDPATGTATVEVVVREGTFERARIDAGSVEFREISRDMSMLCIPTAVPATDGQAAPKHVPDNRDLASAGRFFAAVYPVDPEAFLAQSNFMIGASVPRNNALSNFGRWSNYCERLDKIRTTTARPGGMSPRYVAGFVSSLAGLHDPNLAGGATARGAHFSTTPYVALLLDKDLRGKPNGESLCHEIGHAPPFLLPDTYDGGLTWDQKPGVGVPSDIPHDLNGIIVGDRYRPFDPQGLWEDATCVHPGPVATDDVHDFMGRSSYAWTDPRTDRMLFEAAAKSARGTPIFGALMIAGTLDDDGTGAISPLYVAAGEETPLPSDEADAYVAELLDGSDQVLASQEFDAPFLVEVLGDDGAGGTIGQHIAVDSVPFAVPMPNDPSAVKARIRHGVAVVAERTKSDNAPTIELVAPHGPGTLNGIVEVSWTANDVDAGDAENLTFDVFFSPDGGFSRLVLAVNEAADEIDVDMSTLPGGDSCRFIVRVSDGWNSAEAQSEPAFAVADGEPQVGIDNPLSSATLEAGALVALAGSAWDAEDGMLMGEALAWTVDGVPVGMGLTVVTTLTAGQHTIRLTATDSASNVDFAEVEVNVEEPPPLQFESNWWAVMGPSAP